MRGEFGQRLRIMERRNSLLEPISPRTFARPWKKPDRESEDSLEVRSRETRLNLCVHGKPDKACCHRALVRNQDRTLFLLVHTFSVETEPSGAIRNGSVDLWSGSKDMYPGRGSDHQ